MDDDENQPHARTTTVLVCINRRHAHARPSCAGRGSEALIEPLRRALERTCPGVAVRTIRCFGRCAEGPNVRIAPGGPFLRGVDAANIDVVVDAVRAFRATGPRPTRE